MHFKHTHTRYPKTLLLAYVVLKYAPLGCHVKSQMLLSSLEISLCPGPEEPPDPADRAGGSTHPPRGCGIPGQETPKAQIGNPAAMDSKRNI